jgi:hypothetical protein
VSDKGCGTRSGEFICIAPLERHPLGQHYFVKAEQPCPRGDGLTKVCVAEHTDGLGPRLHCVEASTHNTLLTAASS